jgi:hypothetical protein
LNPAFHVAHRVGVFIDLRMLLCCRNLFSRAARSVLPLSPNSFSKTARGFHSMGNGCVGLRQEIVCV